MVNIKKGFVKFAMATALAVPFYVSTAVAEPSVTPNTDKLLERPSWLPELPKINTQGFSPNSAVYAELRKKILENRDKEAIKDLEKLARNGHAASLVLIGYLLDQEPTLVPTNSNSAAQYWQKAAQAGDSVAIYNLGILYLNGRGVPQNVDTANKLFGLAADKGMYLAYYLRGQLLEKNIQYLPALNQYRRCLGAKQLVQCKTRYGILSITKTKLNTKQAKEVINLLAAASKAGDLEATYTLARLAAEGIVLDKSLATMVYYLETMVKSPNTNNNYRQLAAKMYTAYNPTQDDIKKGQDNYRIANAGGVATLIYRPIDTTKPVLDKGNIIE